MVMHVFLRCRCWTFPPSRHTGRMTAATYTYDPGGNTTTSTGALATTNPWHYAGSYTDAATGYLKLGARYYNPTTARFTQPDPAALYGGYTYAGDNPTNYTDPTGRDFITNIIGIAVGAVITLGCWGVTDGLGAYACFVGGVAAGAVVTGGLDYVVYGESPFHIGP
jgi:RHS repeat-associated protein